MFERLNVKRSICSAEGNEEPARALDVVQPGGAGGRLLGTRGPLNPRTSKFTELFGPRVHLARAVLLPPHGRPAACPLDVTQLLTGKRILFAGATGFVGKVSLSMLLHHYGEELAHVYVLVRRGSSKDATTRFYDKVAPASPSSPARQVRRGGAPRLAPVEVHHPRWRHHRPLAGVDEPKARALKGAIDVVVNCAGLVSFNPSLEVASTSTPTA